MRWLIRKVHRKGKGQVSYEDDIHFGEVLSIGRGADQAVFLPDMRAALQHARVTALGKGKYRIESLIDAGVRINGAIVQNATVSAGGQVEIGSTRIELLEAPEDYDAGVEISAIDKTEQAQTKEKARKPTTLGETRLSKRAPAWIAFIVVAALGLLLPLASHYLPALATVLDKTPLPSRGAWQAGELAASHHFFGSDCQTCHSGGFKWVKDQDCLTCHANAPAHADPAKFNLPQLGEARCAHCHRDHNGVDGLVRRDQVLCADCHIGLDKKSGGASTLANYGDFGAQHPAFKVALPKWDDQGAFVPERVVMEPGLSENSGLTFPHDLHLSKEGIASPSGADRVLECADCHKPQPGGALMQPVDFETMCQSCHRLPFDITEPERQVPHARIQEIVYTLDEFYAGRALAGEVKDAAAPEGLRVRRRPGQAAITTAERQLAFTWARDKSRQVAGTLFNGDCKLCHQVAVGRSVEEPWIVTPVRVAGTWWPKAKFTHDKHTTMDCADCHNAAQSKASSDLLIPEISNCKGCHSGEAGGKDRLQSGCISCHAYHQSPHLLQAQLQGTTSAGKKTSK